MKETFNQGLDAAQPECLRRLATGMSKACRSLIFDEVGAGHDAAGVPSNHGSQESTSSSSSSRIMCAQVPPDSDYGDDGPGSSQEEPGLTTPRDQDGLDADADGECSGALTKKKRPRAPSPEAPSRKLRSNTTDTDIDAARLDLTTCMSTQKAGKRTSKPTLQALMDASLLAEGDKIVCRTREGTLTQDGTVALGDRCFASVSQFAHFCGLPSSANGWRWCGVLSGGEAGGEHGAGRCLQDVRESMGMSEQQADQGDCSGGRGKGKEAPGEQRTSGQGGAVGSGSAASVRSHQGGARQVRVCARATCARERARARARDIDIERGGADPLHEQYGFPFNSCKKCESMAQVMRWHLTTYARTHTHTHTHTHTGDAVVPRAQVPTQSPAAGGGAVQQMVPGKERRLRLTPLRSASLTSSGE